MMELQTLDDRLDDKIAEPPVEAPEPPLEALQALETANAVALQLQPVGTP